MDARADGRRFAEIKWCALHRAQLAGGNQRAVHRRESARRHHHHMPEDVAVTGQIEIGMLKSNGVPSTGRNSPVGISVLSTGVNLLAGIITTCPRRSEEHTSELQST